MTIQSRIFFKKRIMFFAMVFLSSLISIGSDATVKTDLFPNRRKIRLLAIFNRKGFDSGISPIHSGAAKPFEAIFVSSKINVASDPLIVVLHGGPHSVSLSSFSKSLAFLTSIGFSLLIVNYR